LIRRLVKMTPFEPQNPLESALVKAAEDPAARPQFLRLLLESQVLIEVVGPRPKTVNGRTTASAQIQVKGIHFNGRPCIPFFTSDARLPPGTAYLLLRSKELFQMMQGQNFVVNPGSAYGKDFFANEITQMLDGTAFLPEQKLVVPNKAQWLIAETTDYPTELVAALCRFYSTKPQVKRAWIAHYQNAENTEGEGSLIVALELSDVGALETQAGEGAIKTQVQLSTSSIRSRFISKRARSAGKDNRLTTCDHRMEPERLDRRRSTTSLLAPFNASLQNASPG
jgi:hypothetical protein